MAEHRKDELRVEGELVPKCMQPRILSCTEMDLVEGRAIDYPQDTSMC
jgi:hypothetical protein